MILAGGACTAIDGIFHREPDVIITTAELCHQNITNNVL